MFVLTTMVDSIRIAPSMFAQPTLECVHDEIEKKYPNRVVVDVGLVVCRYGDALQLGDGVCVAGDGAAHHEVVFRVVVFRPFVDEVCVGTIQESSEEGLRVELGTSATPPGEDGEGGDGFFSDVLIPAYWMLRPSHYEAESGLWVWTPDYGEEEEEEEGEATTGETKKEEESSRFEMEIGSEIRFKVKSIYFTKVTNTAKGVQATTTSSSNNNAQAKSSSAGGSGGGPRNVVSSALDINDSSSIPAAMNIVASICEDGLGLTSWWGAGDEEEEEVEEEAEVVDGEEEVEVEQEEECEEGAGAIDV